MLSWAAGGDWPRPTTTIAVAPTFPQSGERLALEPPKQPRKKPAPYWIRRIASFTKPITERH